MSSHRFPTRIVVGLFAARRLNRTRSRRRPRSRLTLKGHTDAVNAVAFSPDGKVVVTAGADKKVHVWDVTTGKQMRTMVGGTNSILAIAMSPDGKVIATGGGGTVNVFDAATGKQIIAIRIGGAQDVGPRSIVYSPDGRRMASAADDGSVRLFDCFTGKELLSSTAAHTARQGQRCRFLPGRPAGRLRGR